MIRSRITLLLAAVVACACTSVASGFWTASGAGAGTASVGSLDASTLAAPTTVASTVSLTWSAVSAPGAPGARYYVTRDGSTAGGSCGTPSSPIGATTCSDTDVSDGDHAYRVVTVWNSWTSTSAAETVSVVGDVDAPTTSATVSPAPNAAGWNKGDLNVDLAAADNASGSGIKRITYSASGAQAIAETVANADTVSVPITSEGTTTLSFFAEDNAGNVEVAKTRVVKLDKTAPVVTITPARSPNASGWYRSSITFTAAGTDAGGSGGVTCDAANTYTGPDSATASVTMTCTDAAGNQGSKQHDFKYDATAPSLAVAAARGADVGGWYNAPVSFSVADQADATSGIATCDAAAGYSAPDGQSLRVSRTCTDVAGNVGTATSAAFNFDDTNPAVTLTSNRTANGAGWINADPTFSASASDATSGPGTCDPSITRTAETSSGSVALSCTDVAGNSGSDTKTYKLDKTAPSSSTMTALPNQGYIQNGQSLTGSAADVLSGVSKLEYRYCDASSAATCTPGTVLGTGTLATSYPFSLGASPGNGSYRAAAVAHDQAGNTLMSSIQTMFVQNQLQPTGIVIAGNNDGRWGSGDTIRITFDSPVDVQSVCSAWTRGAASSIATATMTLSGRTDDFTISDTPTCSGGFKLGSMDNSGDFVNGNGATTYQNSRLEVNAANTAITLTLGGSIQSARVTGPNTFVYTPATTMVGRSQVAVSGTAGSSMLP